MSNYRWLIGGVCAALLSIPHAAWAQPSAPAASTIPPPLTPAQIEERRRDNKNDLVQQGATSMPGLIFEGSKILAQKVDPKSVESAMKGAETGSSIISYSVTGAKIAIGTGKDGWEGFKREGTQAVLDKGSDVAGQALAGQAVRIGVAGGLGAGTAAGAAGIAYTGGSLFGTYLRNSVDVGQSLGLRGTIGDEVDTFWFNRTPDNVKEWVSGTKQVDIDDPAVLQRMRDTAERNRRQATFDAVQRENLAQQQQMQAASVQMSGELSPPPAVSPYDATANSLQGILDAARAAQAPRPSLVTPAAPAAPRASIVPQSSLPTISAPRESGVPTIGACKLDPKTGCHPGHDEKSHPGGCKKC